MEPVVLSQSEYQELKDKAMTKPKLLICHDGQFHLDEVMTVALLFSVFGRLPYERRRKVTTEELEDPEVWVLDQYGMFAPALHNFDHHQDKALPATNVLVLEYLREQKLISEDLHTLLRRPFNGISDYDTKGPIPFNGFQVNEFFKTLNNLEDGFKLAVGIAMTWIAGVMKLMEKREEAERVFKNGRSIEGIIRVCSAYPVLWSSMGTEKLLVAPEKGQWRLHSSDTTLYPIRSTGHEIFLHANLFIASYANKDDAVIAAKYTARIGQSYE